MTFADAPLATLEAAPAKLATQTVDQLGGTSRLDQRKKCLRSPRSIGASLRFWR
jgi:hypothetical protein